ncbi:hypothetical protein ATANTOWER_002537 [Ataeniobius toweri]|uniref:Uncharacterized protein n=1 Tax=Ataeniobius toweri TaxID=208326 RepID=A0ABU7AXF0_9TELE|nr:hypothetical protein [Ataeniobius toweri]
MVTFVATAYVVQEGPTFIHQMTQFSLKLFHFLTNRSLGSLQLRFNLNLAHLNKQHNTAEHRQVRGNSHLQTIVYSLRSAAHSYCYHSEKMSALLYREHLPNSPLFLSPLFLTALR